MSHIRGHHTRSAWVGITAEELAPLLGTTILDLEDAARYLKLEPASLWQAIYRQRIAFVQYGNHKYFVEADLARYAVARGPGVASKVAAAESFEIVNVGRRSGCTIVVGSPQRST